MKRWLCPLLMALLLTGCAEEAPRSLREGERAKPAAVPAAPAVETSAASKAPEEPVQEGDLSARLLEAEPRPLSEAEIKAAYDRAVTAYGWFTLAPLPDNGQVVVVDDALYRRVHAKGLEDLDDLRTHLNGIFTPEVTERLLSGESTGSSYREIDGALYVTGIGRMRDLTKGTARVQTEQVSGTEYAVNVAVDLLDDEQGAVTGLECWSFPYLFTGDRWVFGDFRLVY